MINVSSAFLEQIRSRTDFAQHAEITFADGRSLNLTGDDFTLDNNSITDGAGESSVPLGFAVEKTVKLELTNYDDRYRDYDFFGAIIHLYVVYTLDSGLEDTINYGDYTVVSPESYGETVIVTAADDMYKADKPFSTGLSFAAGVTAMQLLVDVCNSTGIVLGSGSFLNSSFVIPALPEGSYSFRQIIGYIAMIACGNARIGYDGMLYIISYQLSPTPLYTLDQWISRPRIHTDDITITGIRTEVKVDGVDRELINGTDAYAITVDNPLCSTQAKAQELIDNLAVNLVGKTFRAFEGEYIGYPVAEFMDPISFVDGKGVTHTSFLTDITYTFRGKTELKCAADEPLRHSVSYSTGSSTYIRARKLVEAERSARERAIEVLARQIEGSSGIYTTIDVQPDGSKIYYLHNQPDLSESSYIWKMTAEAWAVSSDGGETWNAGMEVNGNVIANILSANGINANWIDTGALTITDSNGNVIFQASKDTHSVYMSERVQIGGDPQNTQTIGDAIDSATSFYLSLSNEHQSIETDSSGQYDVFPTCKTVAKVFYGSRDVSSACTYSVSATGLTGTWDETTRTYTVTDLTATSGHVDISATYNGATATKTFTVSIVRDGVDGADAAVLRIDSSRGNVFKNNSVSTVLTVSVYIGGERITNITALRARFGNSAHLQWYWQKVDETTFGVIVASDSKLSDNGFSLTLTPDEVDTKVTFMCELVV